MGHEVTGHYASWNYFQSLKTDTNPKFIESWKAYPNSSGVTSDPMEAAYISLYLYKALVEAAGSFDVDAVNAAAKAKPITFDAPEGTVTLDGENHHISKPGHIGQINARQPVRHRLVLRQVHRARPVPQGLRLVPGEHPRRSS